jgi:cell division septum initiation protein DivIVA
MTKKQELDAWKDFAESLPIESYSKGGMQSLLIELENAMRSDYLPTLSLFEAGQRASDLIEGAKRTAEGLLKQAQEKADRIVSKAIETDLMYRARIDAWKVKAGKEIDAL